jgi:hypothetical protein
MHCQQSPVLNCCFMSRYTMCFLYPCHILLFNDTAHCQGFIAACIVQTVSPVQSLAVGCCCNHQALPQSACSQQSACSTADGHNVIKALDWF